MTKNEFEIMLNRRVSQEDYNIIEFVYTWHPSITDTDGKKQIATFYCLGGIRVIRDMFPTAVKARDLQAQMAAARKQMDTAREKLNSLRDAYMALVAGEEGRRNEERQDK